MRQRGFWQRGINFLHHKKYMGEGIALDACYNSRVIAVVVSIYGLGDASVPTLHPHRSRPYAGILIVDYGVNFDFHQPFGVNETYYLHYCISRTNGAEELTVYQSHNFPIFNSSKQYACANYI